MSVSYFPSSARTQLPVPVTESAPKHSEDIQEAYVERKDSLLNAIDYTKTVLGDLRTFNKSWPVRYPQLHEHPGAERAEPSKLKSRKSLRRSLSFPDDPSFQADVVVNPARKGMTRSVTLASIADAEDDADVEGSDDTERLIPVSNAADFHVFRLDLKLGAHGSSSSPAALVSQLEKSSIANLLDERISTAVAHIDKLRLRVEDTSSKVLVTGDLNAGKSTFVNALLRREIMPVDQQPCTSAFCEVHDAALENNGKEEVHILKAGVPYKIDDESTFTRAFLSDLDSIVSANEHVEQVLKIYVADTREPSESLISNGVVDISLIDAPGLNRDLVDTTAVFARQEEIDVVVFVVSAENHFTLSAKEFLTNASKEKAYVFIVVNKYEHIRDKAKCKRLVLEQIKQLSPSTYKDADDLVHFVDSATAFQNGAPSFETLESSLRSFVLVKRSKSKLMPASTYLNHLLSDVDLLVGANAIVAQAEFERAKDDLTKSRPVLEKMQSGREALEEALESVEEEGASSAGARTKLVLTDALDLVGQGELGVTASGLHMPSYPGLLGIWDYSRAVRKALLNSLDLAVKLAEDEARVTTTNAVDQIKQLSEKHLPEGVAPWNRVFLPQAMFANQAKGKNVRRKSQGLSGAVVAGGTLGLGIGLAQRPDMLETTLFDLFDVQHEFWVHFGDGKGEDDEERPISTLGIASVGMGALTVVGGKVLGARGIIEGAVRVWDMFENETVRTWAAPVIGATAIGLTVYYILELPNSIPKTVGRRIRASLLKKNEGLEAGTFVDVNVLRVNRETRKVLRLASYDMKDRFRSTMDEKTREVQGAEDLEKRSETALKWFGDVERRTGKARELAGLAGSA
ncbi:hypothetical protein BKA93DRAFT_825871 [Sparassis latifolia]|uniref:Transmembrane GTPase fzo1 n=1 Tax=Sparassis crispa TaxID=139825 RepID=A0A401GSD4_9APHY|nr:Transmembrane GTPase fzo1 [Sparassis crispa]GBE85080.1 Transmembrane GTPase fzo1 [Sparassis crispa]